MGIVALFLALGGTGYAAANSIPDSNDVIHGCVNKKGALRIVAHASSCHAGSETSIAWSGPTAVRYVRAGPAMASANGGTATVNAFCPKNMYPIGGGESGAPKVFVLASKPLFLIGKSAPTGWFVDMQNSNTFPISLFGYVVCARMNAESANFGAEFGQG